MTVSKNYGLSGLSGDVELSKGGARVKNNAGVIELRNNADNAFAVLRAASPVADSDVVTKRYLETNANIYINGQIDGGAPPAPADGVIYIVTTAGGGFALNEIYRRESAAWVLVPVVDGTRVSVADPLSGGTDEYAMGVYMWDADTTEWIFIGPPTAIAKVVRGEIGLLAFGTVSPLNIGALIPQNAYVTKVKVNVTQVFDGTAPTLEIGDAGDTDRFMTSAEIDLATVGLYVVDNLHLYGADTQVIATYVADGSTQGTASILVEYRIA